MEKIASLKPNLWASMADEVPAWVSEKRNKTSVDRTLRWLDECLALDPVCKGLCFETWHILKFAKHIRHLNCGVLCDCFLYDA